MTSHPCILFWTVQLYIKCVQPLVKKHEEEIDRALEQGWKKVEDRVFEVRSKTMTWLSGQVLNTSP